MLKTLNIHLHKVGVYIDYYTVDICEKTESYINKLYTII